MCAVGRGVNGPGDNRRRIMELNFAVLGPRVQILSNLSSDHILDCA